MYTDPAPLNEHRSSAAGSFQVQHCYKGNARKSKVFNFNVLGTEDSSFGSTLFEWWGKCGRHGFGEGLGVNSLDSDKPTVKLKKATLNPRLQEDKSTGCSKLYSTSKTIKMGINHITNELFSLLVTSYVLKVFRVLFKSFNVIRKYKWNQIIFNFHNLFSPVLFQGWLRSIWSSSNLTRGCHKLFTASLLHPYKPNS